MEKLKNVIDSSKLSKIKIKEVNLHFANFFKNLEEWKEKVKAIKVTSSDQKEKIKEAKEARLTLKKIRVDADKTRKELKAESLAFGNTVQSVFNLIKGEITPLEDYLSEQENFAKLEEERKKEEKTNARKMMIRKYNKFVPIGADIEGMDEKDFLNLFMDCMAKANGEKEVSPVSESNGLENIEMVSAGANVEKTHTETVLSRTETIKEESPTAVEMLEEKEEEQTDSEKLKVLIYTITHLELPKMESEKGKEIIDNAEKLLIKISSYLLEKGAEI